ncbi:MAG: NAD-dependent epimerase/dehydratase family protein [Acholeplasmataceae bacterium]|nr:NAD-dependent epimerase/dehydratase family protein [Acholeplasmataceae bacterium]
MSKLFIITGANGHLGNTIIRILKNQNHEVRALILPTDSKKMLESLNVKVYYGDIRKPATLEPLFDLSDTNYLMSDVNVIHAAGIVSISAKKHPILEAVNVLGTKNICDISLKYHVSRMIYVSSVHAIPELQNSETIKEIDFFDPNLVVGAYAKSKSMASQYVIDMMKKGLNAIIVHPSGIIGPNDYGHGHMTMMIEDYLNGFLTSRINGAYDFVDVRDVASGIIQTVTSGKVGSCYILSGHRIDLEVLFEQLRSLSGRKRKIHVLPMWFAKLTAPLAEIFYKLRKLPPIYTSYSLYTLESNSFFSYEKARVDLNYHPRSLDETLYDTVKWLVNQNRVRRYRILKFINQLKPMIKNKGNQ